VQNTIFGQPPAEITLAQSPGPFQNSERKQNLDYKKFPLIFSRPQNATGTLNESALQSTQKNADRFLSVGLWPFFIKSIKLNKK